MKRIKRVVDTGFWSDEKVMEFTPEDKYFMLYLLTNEYTSQLGIYYLPLKKAAFDLGYSLESVNALLTRFSEKYKMVKYSKETGEVAIKNYLLYSIVSGGKPVLDCLKKEEMAVKDKSLVLYILGNLKNKDIKNDTIVSYLEYIDSKYDNENDNDNERFVHESSTNRGCPSFCGRPIRTEHKDIPERNIIPPTFDMVYAYCSERNNGIDAQEFIDFYQSKGWLVGKTRMKDWQSAIRTWEARRKSETLKINKGVEAFING